MQGVSKGSAESRTEEIALPSLSSPPSPGQKEDIWRPRCDLLAPTRPAPSPHSIQGNFLSTSFLFSFPPPQPVISLPQTLPWLSLPPPAFGSELQPISVGPGGESQVGPALQPVRGWRNTDTWPEAHSQLQRHSIRRHTLC